MFVSCSTTRKTTATNTQVEAQLTETTENERHREANETAAVVTNVTTDESRNVVIDFATVEFYPGGSYAQPDSAAFRDWLKNIVATDAIEQPEDLKPPNVKSITKGRATIAGEKKQEARTEAQAERNEVEEATTKQDIHADRKEATETKAEEKPKLTIWDWLYMSVVGGVSLWAIYFAVRLGIKIHRNAKGG